MTTYAIPPEGSHDALTFGKRYAVLTGDERHDFDIEHDNPNTVFSVVDDEGFKLFCLWEGCSHINNADWQRVDEED